jgi:hypothetical protein
MTYYINYLSSGEKPTMLIASSLFECCRDLANFETVRSLLITLTHFGNRSVCISLNKVEMNYKFDTNVEVEN